MSQIPPALPADERRRAFATTGGYIFQWWLSALAWLELNDDEALYLESSEDFEVVSPTSATTSQAKAGTSASLTLRSSAVIQAINHYWALAAQDRRLIRFAFVAQARAGIERGAPFGENTAGIEIWENASTTRDLEKIEQIRTFLRDDEQAGENLTPSLQAFVRQASTEELRVKLIDRIVFDLERETADTVQQLVRDRLIVLAENRHGATVAEAENISHLVFSRVVHVAASKERIALTRAAVLQILESSIVELRKHVALATRPSAAISAADDVLWEAGGGELMLPPLPERLVPRPEIVAQIATKAAGGAALILLGSTGTGKTTLAKMVARTLGGQWWWLDLQGVEARAAQVAFRKILTVADQHRGAALNLVLDGFNSEGLPSSALNTLRAVALLTDRRGGRVILTTQKQITPTEAAGFGWLNPVEYSAPALDASEIARFLVELGCVDTRLADLWASAVHLHTDGHPQLVHAACLWLHQQQWPKFDARSFGASALNVDSERERARRLVARLSNDELELITRLSVLGNSFRRDHALSIAEKLERLPGAAFRFDGLIGPWIEPADSAGYFRLSPLLADSAATVARDRRSSLELASAFARLENRPVYFQDAALALRHAIAAKAAPLTAQVVSKFLVTPHEHRTQVYQLLLWLTWLSDADVNGIFGAKSPATIMLHLLRFHVAMTLIPSRVEPFIKECEKSLSNLPTEQTDGFRFVLLTEALIEGGERLPASMLLRYLEEAPELSDRIDPNAHPAVWFPRALLPPSLRSLAPVAHVRTSLAGLLLGKIRGKVSVEGLVDTLDGMPSERRLPLVQAFGAWPIPLILVLDNIWLAESEKPKPDWEQLLSWLSKLETKAARWNSDVFVVALRRAASVVCNEYLHDQDRATLLIKDTDATTPGFMALIFDQHAKIAAEAKLWSVALDAVRKALPIWDESEFGAHPRALTLQRAGTWAGMAELWRESAAYFEEAAKIAKRRKLDLWYAGLETDAAIACWRAGEKQAALDRFAVAIELCGAMGPPTNDLATFQFQKLLGHIIMSFAMVDRRSPHSPPQAPVIAGMASDLSLNERVKTLPPPRLHAIKVFAAMLEHDHRLGESIWEKYRTELLSSRSLTTRNFSLEIAIRKAVNRGRCEELPALAAQQASAFAVGFKSAARPNAPDEFLKNDDVDMPRVEWAFDDQMCGERLFAVAMIGAAIQLGNLESTLQELESHASESPFVEALKKWIDRARTIAGASEAELEKICRSATMETDRIVAAAALMCLPRLAPKTLWTGCYVLLSSLTNIYWGGDLLRIVDEYLGRRWLAAVENRFAFHNPTLWIPDVRLVCAEPVNGACRVAKMLLAVMPALDLRMDEKIVVQLKELRESATVTPWQKVAPGFR